MSRELSVEEIEEIRPSNDPMITVVRVTIEKEKYNAILDLALRTKAAEQRAGEWRKIESAPKEGSILAWCDSWANPHVVRWSSYGAWKRGGANSANATHWLPLPEPPKSTPKV